ncbi:MAG: cyanophycinase [Treponema sp.]|jgi:cyanophycinase|nr:cyanophycinase [Treponema sp.]
MKKLFLALIALLLPVNTFAQTQTLFVPSNEEAKGKLFIHGGAGTNANQWDPFIALAGGIGAKILVVPFAAEPPYTPQERGPYFVDFLNRRGAVADYAAFTRENADLPENLRKLNGVAGVWFSGGSQTLLRNHLRGTVFLERIKEIYRNGGVIGGTSAGASVMGKVMPAGGVTEGFGFIDFAIIHQHFSELNRQGVLLDAVQEQNIAGIGIDEKTAVIFNAVTKTFEVVGEGKVTVYEPQSTGIRTQIYRAGSRFTINTSFTSGVINTGGYGMGLSAFTASSASIARNEQFTVSFRLRNMEQNAFPGGQNGIALVNNNGNIVGQVMDVRTTQTRNPGTQTSVLTRDCFIPGFTAPGRYQLRIVIRPAGGEWRIATLSHNNAPTSIDFTVR